jgi:single-stranded-DNA-specific exonuclease
LGLTKHQDDMEKRWRIRPHDTAVIERIERTGQFSSVLARLLFARGITDAGSAHRFLDSKLSELRDPEHLPGLTRAADRLHTALQQQQRIVVYGDYDADGMTATAILLRCLRLAGGDVGYYLPNRLDEGYGLNDEALRRLKQEGAEVVVSVDCGITSVAQAETARELDLELIITDHHQPDNVLPDAIVVHPRLPGSSYPFGELCGAGVAFKLAWAVCQRVSQGKRVTEPLREFLLSALGLAALGTVADVVPLLDENRVLVKHGLLSLKSRPPRGVAQLMEVSGLNGKSQLSSEDLAFSLAPRLNAAGRLGQAQLGVELLVTEDVPRAQALAAYIHELNENRLHLERSIYLSAKKQIKESFDPANDAALVLADHGWHQGVIGIVAGRLAERHQRPVVMIALDSLGGSVGTGSARSAGGIDLHKALSACGQHLLQHGGHAAAAGLRIDQQHVDAFRNQFCEHVEQQLDQQARVVELLIDAETTLAELTLSSVQQMERLAPFGAGNPRPVLCASTVQLCGPPQPLGKGDRHVAVQLEQHGVRFRGLAFNRPEWLTELAQPGNGSLDIAFRPVINEFRGRRTVELHLDDWRSSHPAD